MLSRLFMQCRERLGGLPLNVATCPPTSELLCQFGRLLFAGIDHIDRAAIPRMFERKRHDFPDTDESHPEFDIPVQMLQPRLRNRFKSGLVALPSNECDKRLLDVERGA